MEHDKSERFLASAGDFLPANLAALWSADPDLARQVEQVEPYPLERAKDGQYTVAVPTDNGRQLYLHSRHRPLDEARRQIEAVKTDQCVAFYLQGMGLGYSLQLLFEKVSPEAILCVLEPDLRLLRTALDALDLSKAIASNRVMIFHEPSKPQLMTRLQDQNCMLTLGFEGIAHPPSLQRYPDFYRQMQQHLVELVTFFRTSLQTLLINGKRTSENIARNIGWYAASPGIGRLKDRYAGKPAIIVSAGPSLRKNQHLLTEAYGKAVLVAVQTTLKPLLEMGITPHFVTSLDYNEISTRFFDALQPGLTTELVAEPKATDAIFKLFPGHTSLIRNDFAESLLREMHPHRAGLPAGATVAHLSFYLAQYLGCDPIIFVGQDLGFADGLAYTPGTAYEEVWECELSAFCTTETKQWEQIVRDKQILRKIEDVHGDPMYTEERLFSYLQQFERDFAQSTAQVVDATEGGAKKAHTTILTLREAIDTYCRQPLPATPNDHGGYHWDRLPKVLDCVNRRRAEAKRIIQISQRTIPLLEEAIGCLHDSAAVNAVVSRIDTVRREINALAQTLDMILSMSQTNELRKFQQDRLIAAARLEGQARQRKQLERDIDNVKSIAAAAEEFVQLMDDVSAKLQTMQGKPKVAA